MNMLAPDLSDLSNFWYDDAQTAPPYPYLHPVLAAVKLTSRRSSILAYQIVGQQASRRLAQSMTCLPGQTAYLAAGV